MRLKEGNDLPKDTQCILAESEPESRFLASLYVDSVYCFLGRGKEEDRL